MKRYIILLLLLSSCGVRKVALNKAVTEIKSTKVTQSTIDSTKVAVTQENKEEFLKDESITIEYFSETGMLTKRISKNTKIQNNKQSIKDSLKLSVLKQSKDSVVVNIKKTEKVKHTQAFKANFFIIGLVLVLLGLYLIFKK